MSLPILPFGVGSGLTLPFQAWPSPSGSDLAPPLPFLLAGLLAFPFSPFWLAFPLGAWPTPTRMANPDPEKEGPKPQPEKEKPKRKKTTHQKQKKTKNMKNMEN